jgi:mannose-6-phosphate isomerase-like protein (cupin superfamily)
MSYITNIEQKTLENDTFRTVLYTALHSQLVVMSLLPGEEIGSEVHPDTDQFIRIEAGEGKVVLDDEETAVKAEDAVVISAGTEHNVINTSNSHPLKLYTIYSPPNHPDGTIHATKSEADAYEAEEHHE